MAKLELPCTLLKLDRSIHVNADSKYSVASLSSFDVGYTSTLGFKTNSYGLVSLAEELGGV